MWINPNGNDILLAYETSYGIHDGGNHLAVYHYKDLDVLKSGIPTEKLYLKRHLAPTSEGTPSFEEVKWTESLLTSDIIFYFHFHKNNHLDELAQGFFSFVNKKGAMNQTSERKNTDVSSSDQTSFLWKSEPLTRQNVAIRDLGFNGNIGSRQKFRWLGEDFYLLET